MQRRAFFGGLFAIAAGSGVKTTTSGKTTTSRKYGCLTIAGHRHHLHTTGENLCVFLNGAEINKVYEADDIEGYVLAYCTDEDDHRNWGKPGRIHIGGDGGACRMRLTGNVEFRPRPAPVQMRGNA